MKITKVEDVIAFQWATAYWELVNAPLDKPEFSKDCNLRNQIRRAIDSITANVSEGFESPRTGRSPTSFSSAKAPRRNRENASQSRWRAVTSRRISSRPPTQQGRSGQAAHRVNQIPPQIRTSRSRPGNPSPPADDSSAPPHPTSPPDGNSHSSAPSTLAPRCAGRLRRMLLTFVNDDQRLTDD